MAVAATFFAMSATSALAQSDTPRASAAELAIDAAIPRPQPANVPPPTADDFKLDATSAMAPQQIVLPKPAEPKPTVAAPVTAAAPATETKPVEAPKSETAATPPPATTAPATTPPATTATAPAAEPVKAAS